MSFPINTGPNAAPAPVPPYSGTFIPEIWSGKLLQKLYASTVLTSIANTDYEGEIRQQGDRVIIRKPPTVTVRNYQANAELVIEQPGEDVTDLLIDKGKYFAVGLDDVFRHQADIDLMEQFTRDAAEQVKIAIDTEVLAYVVTAAAGANMGPNAGVISHAINLGNPGATPPVPLNVTLNPSSPNDVNPLHLVVQLGQVLDEQNVPMDQRYIVAPAWFISMLKLSDIGDVSKTGDDTSPLRNGRVGRIDNFTIYHSNLLPVVTSLTPPAFYIIAGHRMALTFATQFTKVETMRDPRYFRSILRGLNIYGYKVLRPEALAVAFVRPKYA